MKETTVKKKRPERIVVIGPVYPFKGGISHYTGLLVRALKKDHEVYTISYLMQYPKLLFKKEQRDYENRSFQVEDAEFLINTANPFNIVKCAGYINSLDPDLVIIQWWHPYFSPCYSILSGKIKAKKLFICHNVFPHERFPFDRLLTGLVLKKGDYFILHSKKEASELLSLVPKAAYAVNMHPTYSAFRLGEPAPFRKEDRKLNVVGDFGGKREEYDRLIGEYGIQSRVFVRDGYVPDKEVEDYFESCDAVVLPYIDATQSGIAQIAFGFEKPVIATRAGGLPEVVTDGKTGVLCEVNDPDSLAEAVRRFSALRQEINFKDNIRQDAWRFSWEHMVLSIEELVGF